MLQKIIWNTKRKIL